MSDMPISLYQVAVPPVLQMLENLDAILDKAEAHCTAHKIAPEVLLQTRLFPNMFAFTRQIQIATDQAKGCIARLAGVDLPSYPDSETSFAELKQRLAKTIAFIKTFTPAQIDGAEEKEIILKVGGQERKFLGQPYLLNFVLPNLYFHATTAYNILRANGVELAKSDFLGKS
jgi:hypothetical protein